MLLSNIDTLLIPLKSKYHFNGPVLFLFNITVEFDHYDGALSTKIGKRAGL